MGPFDSLIESWAEFPITFTSIPISTFPITFAFTEISVFLWPATPPIIFCSKPPLYLTSPLLFYIPFIIRYDPTVSVHVSRWNRTSARMPPFLLANVFGATFLRRQTWLSGCNLWHIPTHRKWDITFLLSYNCVANLFVSRLIVFCFLISSRLFILYFFDVGIV